MPKPQDLGMLEDDMGSIQDKTGQLRRPMDAAAGIPKRPTPAGVAPKRPRVAPAGTPDLGKLEDDMGSIQDKTGQLPRPMGRNVPAGPSMPPRVPGMKKGGSVGSASKRADGIATKGKTKGRFV